MMEDSTECKHKMLTFLLASIFPDNSASRALPDNLCGSLLQRKLFPISSSLTKPSSLSALFSHACSTKPRQACFVPGHSVVQQLGRTWTFMRRYLSGVIFFFTIHLQIYTILIFCCCFLSVSTYHSRFAMQVKSSYSKNLMFFLQFNLTSPAMFCIVLLCVHVAIQLWYSVFVGRTKKLSVCTSFWWCVKLSERGVLVYYTYPQHAIKKLLSCN